MFFSTAKNWKDQPFANLPQIPEEQQMKLYELEAQNATLKTLVATQMRTIEELLNPLQKHETNLSEIPELQHDMKDAVWFNGTWLKVPRRLDETLRYAREELTKGRIDIVLPAATVEELCLYALKVTQERDKYAEKTG